MGRRYPVRRQPRGWLSRYGDRLALAVGGLVGAGVGLAFAEVIRSPLVLDHLFGQEAHSLAWLHWRFLGLDVWAYVFFLLGMYYGAVWGMRLYYRLRYRHRNL